jgi:hypothetical protein
LTNTHTFVNKIWPVSIVTAFVKVFLLTSRPWANRVYHDAPHNTIHTCFVMKPMNLIGLDYMGFNGSWQYISNFEPSREVGEDTLWVWYMSPGYCMCHVIADTQALEFLHDIQITHMKYQIKSESIPDTWTYF